METHELSALDCSHNLYKHGLATVVAPLSLLIGLLFFPHYTICPAVFHPFINEIMFRFALPDPEIAISWLAQPRGDLAEQ